MHSVADLVIPLTWWWDILLFFSRWCFIYSLLCLSLRSSNLTSMGFYILLFDKRMKSFNISNDLHSSRNFCGEKRKGRRRRRTNNGTTTIKIAAQCILQGECAMHNTHTFIKCFQTDKIQPTLALFSQLTKMKKKK